MYSVLDLPPDSTPNEARFWVLPPPPFLPVIPVAALAGIDIFVRMTAGYGMLSKAGGNFC